MTAGILIKLPELEYHLDSRTHTTFVPTVKLPYIKTTADPKRLARPTLSFVLREPVVLPPSQRSLFVVAPTKAGAHAAHMSGWLPRTLGFAVQKPHKHVARLHIVFRLPAEIRVRRGRRPALRPACFMK
jgi:hypothetical protein